MSPGPARSVCGLGSGSSARKAPLPEVPAVLFSGPVPSVLGHGPQQPEWASRVPSFPVGTLVSWHSAWHACSHRVGAPRCLNKAARGSTWGSCFPTSLGRNRAQRGRGAHGQDAVALPSCGHRMASGHFLARRHGWSSFSPPGFMHNTGKLTCDLKALQLRRWLVRSGPQAPGRTLPVLPPECSELALGLLRARPASPSHPLQATG